MPDKIIHKWLRIPYALNVRYLLRENTSKATLLFIHGIGSTGDMWQQVIEKLPKDLNVDIVTLDLLGFGKSPHPKWETYNAKTQARSVLATVLKLRIKTPIIVIGHSLGSLVSVEFAKRYPLFTHTLILCSPPIYRGEARLLDQESILKILYVRATLDPENLAKMYEYAISKNLLGQGMFVNKENIDVFINTLHASIINQTTIKDIGHIKIPVKIINGIFDPFVVRKNLVTLAKKHHNIELKDVNSAHQLTQLYRNKIIRVIEETVKEIKSTRIKNKKLLSRQF